MSVKIMSAVFDRYPNGGGEMVLALALADHAHDDGSHVYPSVKGLAEKTRQSERTVQYQLRKMESEGWLILVSNGNGGRNITREYRISSLWIKGANSAPFNKGCNLEQERVQPDAEKGANGDIKGAIAVAPEPSITISEPSVEPSIGKTKRTKRASADFDVSQLKLPDWMPKAAWDAFVEMRTESKKPIKTMYAAKLLIDELSDLQAKGQDPLKILNNSIMNGWQGFYPLKESRSGRPSGVHGGFDGIDYRAGVNPDGTF